MNKPRKQHYLPKSAHLSNFRISGTEQVWVYQRENVRFKQNIGDAGALRDLYSTRKKDGELDFTIEQLLSKQVEAPVQSVINKLLSVSEDFSITEEEKAAFVRYVATLKYRTLTIRRVLCDVKTGFTKEGITNLAQDKAAFRQWIEKAVNDGLIPKPDVSIERIREALADGFWMGLVDGPIVLRGIFEFSEAMAKSAMNFGIRVIEIPSTDQPLYTCDNPICSFSIPPRAKADPFLVDAENHAFSLSPYRNVVIQKDTKDPLQVRFFRGKTGASALINKSTLVQADRYVFSSVEMGTSEGLFKEPSCWKHLHVPSNYRPKP